MKKKNKKDYSNKRFILVFIMMLCLIISMSTYWVYAYHHKYGKNYYEDKFISYKVSDYVTIEGNYVYLKNISDDISNNFIRSQKEIIKNNIIDMTVTKGIYKEILSIKISYILNADLSNYIILVLKGCINYWNCYINKNEKYKDTPHCKVCITNSPPFLMDFYMV